MHTCWNFCKLHPLGLPAKLYWALEANTTACSVHFRTDPASACRFAIWPKVREFIEGLPPGAVMADVGCGNGKYFGVRRDVAVLGSDRSAGLAQVAAQRLAPNSPGGEAVNHPKDSTAHHAAVR